MAFIAQNPTTHVLKPNTCPPPHPANAPNGATNPNGSPPSDSASPSDKSSSGSSKPSAATTSSPSRHPTDPARPTPPPSPSSGGSWHTTKPSPSPPHHHRSTQTTHHPILPILSNHSHLSSNIHQRPNPLAERPLRHNNIPITEAPSPITTVPSPASHSPPPPEGEIKRGSLGEGNRAAKGPDHPNYDPHHRNNVSPLRSAKGDASAASRGMPVIHRHVIPAPPPRHSRGRGNPAKNKARHSPNTPPQKPNHQPVSQFVPQFETKPCTSTYMVLPNCTSHFHLTATALLY